jgi:hypothetical protein
MLRRRWLCKLWGDFLEGGGREIWESNGSILILAIPLPERTMVSYEFLNLTCGRRLSVRMGKPMRGDKQIANQALTVQLRQLRLDGVDPIQELRLYIPWLGHNSFYHQYAFFQGAMAHINHAGAREERRR